MPEEYRPDPNFRAWGPFINPDTYIIQPVTRTDLIVAGTIFGLSMSFAILAACLGIKQTLSARRPAKSVYVWMIWLELAACVVIAFECLLYLLQVIEPSFYFYMSILQLLLQIIINRIRVILADRQKGRIILITVAVIVTLINISVFCIWMPARLQISTEWIHINEVWDRIEKVLYLLIDGSLNWYFIRVVKANLIDNGLEKYNKLVHFNQRIIVISLLMDVMIIAAMSIPNGFVYAIFHPSAYLIKLIIEMSMANLIKKIAISNSRRTPTISNLYEFASGALEMSSMDHSNSSHPPKPQTDSSLKHLNSDLSTQLSSHYMDEEMEPPSRDEIQRVLYHNYRVGELQRHHGGEPDARGNESGRSSDDNVILPIMSNERTSAVGNMVRAEWSEEVMRPEPAMRNWWRVEPRQWNE
ncbi:hypothetical protein BS50DRAFT_630515 [Corynespora cassiicola Philippines]|uniref:Integral membrane protein n=1 Tax=Corynespora cassiicola Philippines TaxID=1448308 RepID=A0A2T2P476_CORCC|nr:hypothetical protein BS50DRAFT_630515 [Corynespora cassiicola Philippines]